MSTEPKPDMDFSGLDLVAALVARAGGHVRIKQEDVLTPRDLSVMFNPDTNEVILHARKKQINGAKA